MTFLLSNSLEIETLLGFSTINASQTGTEARARMLVQKHSAS